MHKFSVRVLHTQGFIMPVLLFTITLIVTLVALVGSLALNTYNLATRESYKVNAQMAADAGLDVGIHEFNLDNTWTGTSSSDVNWSGVGGEINLLDTPRLRTTYETTIMDGGSDDRKIVSVTARSYSPGTATNPKITRKYEVDLQAVTSGYGPSAVVSGVGGLVLNNNAKITGGDVVVNGTIYVGGNAQIGLSTTLVANAVNIRVAHMNCPSPADATYPRVCNPGENGQPISVDNNGKVYADVRATNQTDGTWMYNPGLIVNQTVPPITLPAYDREAHKNAVVLPHRPSSESIIACGNNQSKTWPANVKIVGDISLGNNCIITLSGDTWITGSVNFGNNARIVVPDSLGTTMPVVMIDGANGFRLGNNGLVQPNSFGTGVYFITYWSSATCSPDCADVTGVDLKNSQNVVKIELDTNGSAPGSILYSRWSRARISNNGAIGAVAGQSIELGSNAVINFTASVPGSDNLTITWVKRGYMRVYE
jgi:hypothetical protein